MAKGSGSFVARIRAPLVRPRQNDDITITTHRELVVMAKTLAKRLGDDPDFSVMLLANPVLALREYGVKLTPELEHHVLTTLRHPPKLRTRREELEASLEKALGEVPKPTDPAWLARLVFEKREIEPREISGQEPVYKPALNAGTIANIRGRLPAATSRYPGIRRIKVVHRMGVAPSRPTLRRIDLDAPLPDLRPAKKPPSELTIEQGWFYKDDAIVRDAVELGIIIRRGFPFKTPAEFRELAEGKKADAFRTFVRAVGIRTADRT